MKLSHPVCICSNLQPGVRIGDTEVSIMYHGTSPEGRTVYRYDITGPGVSHSGDDLKSGVGGGGLREGLESLLAFLGACAESFPDGENADLFPAGVGEWAAQYSDEIGMAQIEIEENEDCIEE